MFKEKQVVFLESRSVPEVMAIEIASMLNRIFGKNGIKAESLGAPFVQLSFDSSRKPTLLIQIDKLGEPWFHTKYPAKIYLKNISGQMSIDELIALFKKAAKNKNID